MFDQSPRHLSSQDGFALPTVLFMLLAAFAIAWIAVISSINAQHGTTRDMDTKDALAAAEAGVQQAMVRYNAGAVAGTCAPGDSSQAGWCVAQQVWIQPRGTVNYSVLPGAGVIDIVSQGTVGGRHPPRPCNGALGCRRPAVHGLRGDRAATRCQPGVQRRDHRRHRQPTATSASATARRRSCAETSRSGSDTTSSRPARLRAAAGRSFRERSRSRASIRPTYAPTTATTSSSAQIR